MEYEYYKHRLSYPLSITERIGKLVIQHKILQAQDLYFEMIKDNRKDLIRL